MTRLGGLGCTMLGVCLCLFLLLLAARPGAAQPGERAAGNQVEIRVSGPDATVTLQRPAGTGGDRCRPRPAGANDTFECRTQNQRCRLRGVPDGRYCAAVDGEARGEVHVHGNTRVQLSSRRRKT